MPGKEEFITSCADEIEGEHKPGDPKIDGQRVCSCLLDVFAAEYTYAQFKKMTAKNGKGIGEAISDKNSPIYAQSMKCIMKSIVPDKDDEDSKKPLLDTEDEDVKESFMSSCITASKNSIEKNGVEMDVNIYCTCTWDKIIEYGLSLADLGQIADPNSVMFNKIITPCVNRAMGTEDTATALSPEEAVEKGKDIIGENPTEKVSLTKLMGVYRANVKVGTVEKLFILDSGASVVFLSSDYERELLLDGVIKKEDYRSPRAYMMANGKKEECRRVVLNNVHVGGYVVNNVMAAISSQSEAMLLLGKSFLDKFSNWSIDNSSNTLILTK